MKNNFTNADLPVGTAITFNDEGVVREDHVLGNYSLTSGEIRTAWAGMVCIDNIIEKSDDTFFLSLREEVQRIKSLLGATDNDMDAVNDLIRGVEYGKTYYKSKFVRKSKGVYKPKKEVETILQTIDKGKLGFFYPLAWFDYLFLDNMPPRLPQK